MEIKQIERWKLLQGEREEEWLVVKAGAALGHIRSLGLELDLPKNCGKSRRCRRGDGSSRRRDRRQPSQELSSADTATENHTVVDRLPTHETSYMLTLEGMFFFFPIFLVALLNVFQSSPYVQDIVQTRL